MIYSAGILIKLIDKREPRFLFVHPTGSKWQGTYSIPKGEYKLDEESSVSAAIRETSEEVGIKMLPIELLNIDSPITIDYVSKSGKKKYKTVKVYKAEVSMKRIGSFIDKNLLNIHRKFLQLEEVDWAGFLTKKDLYDRIFWRFKPLIYTD